MRKAMMPVDKEINYLHSMIREVREDHLLYDVHAHPFNVAFPCPEYRKDPEIDGLFSVGNSPYNPPTLSGAHLLDDDTPIKATFAPALRRKAVALHSRALYSHTGPRVMVDHMKLACIDKILLLPVMATHESGEAKMDLLDAMFSGHEQFACAYCVPNDVLKEDVIDAIGRAKSKYRIKAIKIHPNITGIDLATVKGQERIHLILEGSSVHALPVIVHGGLSLEFLDGKAARYACPDNLQKINWKITNEPVILAHAAMFGFDDITARNEVIPVLNGLLRKFENLVVDISGMSLANISTVLENVASDRILFGSDALYFPQWLMVLRLARILKELDRNITNRFIALMHENPKRYVFHG
jgi:predicted TIM-barrel fold metal-dependent hydrolase